MATRSTADRAEAATVPTRLAPRAEVDNAGEQEQVCTGEARESDPHGDGVGVAGVYAGTEAREMAVAAPGAAERTGRPGRPVVASAVSEASSGAGRGESAIEVAAGVAVAAGESRAGPAEIANPSALRTPGVCARTPPASRR